MDEGPFAGLPADDGFPASVEDGVLADDGWSGARVASVLGAPPAIAGAVVSGTSSGPKASFHASAPCFTTKSTTRPATSASPAWTSTMRQ